MLRNILKLGHRFKASTPACGLRALHVAQQADPCNTNADEEVLHLASSFARQELLPHAASLDQHSIFPVESLRKAAHLGLAGIYVSEV